jgi:predicted nucleotidyltransferase
MGKHLTVLGGRAMFALNKDYRASSFIAEEMYGDTRADIGCEVDVATEAAISPYIRQEVLREAVSL